MSIVLVGSTSGSCTLQEQAVAGTTVLTLPTTSGTVATLTTPSFVSTIGVGGATPSTSGAGITFPATQSASTDANTLDDYEEGSWTPSVGGTATYQAQTGQYVRIGRFVHAVFDMIINQIGTGATNAVNGLPFAAGGNTQGQSGTVGFYSGFSTGVSYLALRIDLGSTQIALAANTGNQTTITAGLSVFTNSSRLVGSIVYQVS